jgi:hypothetical protein
MSYTIEADGSFTFLDATIDVGYGSLSADMNVFPSPSGTGELWAKGPTGRMGPFVPAPGNPGSFYWTQLLSSGPLRALFVVASDSPDYEEDSEAFAVWEDSMKEQGRLDEFDAGYDPSVW